MPTIPGHTAAHRVCRRLNSPSTVRFLLATQSRRLWQGQNSDKGARNVFGVLALIFRWRKGNAFWI